jgi:hypothetical protein
LSARQRLAFNRLRQSNVAIYGRTATRLITAKIKGIKSAIAARAQILVLPDLEAVANAKEAAN